MRTLGSLLFALQVQGDGVPSAGSGDLVRLIADTTPLNQAVLIILVSVLGRVLGNHPPEILVVPPRASRYDPFSGRVPPQQQVLRGAGGLSLAARHPPGRRVSSRLRRDERAVPGRRQLGADPPASNPTPAPARPTLKSLDGVDRALIRAATNEVSKLERRMTFLATTAGVTPFIGLFGTVVGIMIAFQRIGATGSTNLAIVAPGISEALIATAAGLFAAIPALVFYNHFTHRVKEFSATMDDFALEFLNIAERNFT